MHRIDFGGSGMSKNDKIKLGVAVSILVVAGGMIIWQFAGSGDRVTKIDPEMAGPEVTAPKNPKGQVESEFGNRAVPPR